MYKLAYTVDGRDEWRKKESQRLGNLVQRRLDYIQNPNECGNAKKLVCADLNRCGFGCVLHRITACLIVAYATRRTVVLQSRGWRYSNSGWTSMFLPLGKNCSTAKSWIYWRGNSTKAENAQAVRMPDIDSKYLRRPSYFPLAVPEDLVDRIARFHGDPPVWWIGQFVKFAARPNRKLKHFLDTKKKLLRFKQPIVGVHIRRTDKVRKEAQMHSVEEYMKHVKEWYDIYEKRDPGVQRRVYVASDDPSVLSEAIKKYPQYIFISDKNASKSASLRNRYSEESLRGVILDIYMLSWTDFLVCTFSSQVCRVAFELMQPQHGDASQRFKSLDDIYYFGGQKSHRWKMTESHEGLKNDELTLNASDIIEIHGNHWDGFSKGRSVKTGRVGLFPSYKAVDIVEYAKMPTYPEVPEYD